MQPSGKLWVPQFPASKSLDDLVEPFRSNARRFLAALKQANATVVIADTLRRPERAYLMFFSFMIANNHMEPSKAPPMPGVAIQWVHMDSAGQADAAGSLAAAKEMVAGYGIVFQPALFTRHSEGKAIDMSISWAGNLTIVDGHGATVTITSTPRTGAANEELMKVGASYGVIKLKSDAPHWSLDGH
jgi:hypothetical protein